MSKNTSLHQLPTELGNNLVLRFATRKDTDELVDFNTRIHEESAAGFAVRDLMTGKHPTTQAADFTVVEDTNAREIVSSMCLISQSWSYGGIPFKLGRPEFVATDPDYRKRGLVRKQFEVIHAVSAQKGELMQGITGIPWFYRQFGYEMALDLEANRILDDVNIPSRTRGRAESCRLRARSPVDNAFIQELYQIAIERQVFACPRSALMWEYELEGRSEGSGARFEWEIIEDLAGTRLGYVTYLPMLWQISDNPCFWVTQLELKPGIGYLYLMQSLLRSLWAKAKKSSVADNGKSKNAKGIAFTLGRDHQAYTAMPNYVLRNEDSYAWHIRIPDTIAFLRHIHPALEKHLVGTVAEAYTGELRLNFYQGGLRMKFEAGHLSEISRWCPGSFEDGDVQLPGMTFWQVLCGRFRTNELTSQFADCSATSDAAVLLDCLFPPFTGDVWALE
ncbi:MAG: GNAT family N-acetyltransferase [Candidatus Poribacteria bacterium]|nr:GNAT family N-acetyltransferase [Candidatus Poribacteria bacterium]MDE0506552.1 GNAT family N-acetyltransferase [Candidatus Poribacteria bacterium]